MVDQSKPNPYLVYKVLAELISARENVNIKFKGVKKKEEKKPE